MCCPHHWGAMAGAALHWRHLIRMLSLTRHVVHSTLKPTFADKTGSPWAARNIGGTMAGAAPHWRHLIRRGTAKHLWRWGAADGVGGRREALDLSRSSDRLWVPLFEGTPLTGPRATNCQAIEKLPIVEAPNQAPNAIHPMFLSLTRPGHHDGPRHWDRPGWCRATLATPDHMLTRQA